MLLVRYIAVFFACILLGCGAGSKPGDFSAESTYVWGQSRAELENQHGRGRLIRVEEKDPDDIFAASTMREMISLGKPRPRSYEIFYKTHTGSAQERYHLDYVFFNDLDRVIYVARRAAQ